MAEAPRRTGLSDFGDDRFREGLRRPGRRASTPGTPRARFGRLFFREYCTGLLVNRLKIQADLTRHPEILDVPVAPAAVHHGTPPQRHDASCTA